MDVTAVAKEQGLLHALEVIKLMHAESCCDEHEACEPLGICVGCDYPSPCPTRLVADRGLNPGGT